MVTSAELAKLPHLYLVREQLDCLAGRLTAQAATPEDIRALHVAAHVRPGPDATHLDHWAINVAFHRTIHRAAHNPVLSDVLNRVYLQYDRYNGVFLDYLLDATAQEHAAMVSAIEEKRVDDIEKLMRTHYEHGRRFLPVNPTEHRPKEPGPDYSELAVGFQP